MRKRFGIRMWFVAAALALGAFGRGAAQETPPAPPAPDTPPADAEEPAAPVEDAPSDDDVEATPEESTETDTESPESPESTEPAEQTDEDALDADDLDESDYDDLDELDPGSAVHLGEGQLQLTLDDVFTSGGTVATVGEAELSRLGYTDPTNVVQRVPGVTVRVEDGFGLRPNIAIRGTNPERSRGVTLMEDGVLFGPAPYSAPAAYYFPLISRMVGVDVYKGPAAILFGPQTVGGAVNFVSRDVPTTPGGEVRLSYGSYGSRLAQFHYGLSNARAGFLVEAVDLGSRGFKDIDFRPRDETGFSRTEAVLRGFVQSRTTRAVYHRLGLTLSYSRERSNETYLGLTDADFAAAPDRRYLASANDQMKWQRFSYRLDHRLETQNGITLTTTLYRHDFHRLWHRFDRLGNGAPNVADVLAFPDNPSSHQIYYGILTGTENTDPNAAATSILYANNDRTFVSQGVQTTFTFARERGRLAHQIRAGIRLHYDEILRNHSSESYASQDGQLVRDASPELATRHELANAYAAAFYGAYSLTVGDLRVTPGGRMELIRTGVRDYGIIGDGSDRSKETGFLGVILWGIGLNYEVLDALSVFGGVHRGFSPTAPGSADVADPELSTNSELGARFRDDELGLRVELSGFVNAYSNMLLTCSGAGGCPVENIDQQFNAGSALIGGLEFAYAQSVELPADLTMPLTATYSYQRSRFQDWFTSTDPQYADVSVGDEIPYLPRHQATVGAGLEHDRFRVNATGTFVSKMREQAGSGDQGWFTDRQAYLDMTGEVRVHGRIHLTLRLDNVTNSRPIVAHRPFGARPYRPFMAQAGLRIEL